MVESVTENMDLPNLGLPDLPDLQDLQDLLNLPDLHDCLPEPFSWSGL